MFTRAGVSQMWAGVDRREESQKSLKICGRPLWMTPYTETITASKNLLLNQHGKQHPLEEKRLRKITVSNMEVFRKNFKMKGISVNAGELKFDARTDDPAANYELPCGQWANWSSKAKIDPF